MDKVCVLCGTKLEIISTKSDTKYCPNRKCNCNVGSRFNLGEP